MTLGEFAHGLYHGLTQMTYKMYYVKLSGGKVWETTGNRPGPSPVLPQMTRLPLPHVALAAALGGALPADASTQRPPPPAAQVTVEYLANEGVLITHGQLRILVDALTGEGLPDYPVALPATRDSLERALGRFTEVDLVLVTHVHRDHFNARAMANHLRANPGAVVVGSSQVADSLRLLAGWSDPSRTRILPATPGTTAELRHAGTVVTAHGIPHPPSRNQPVEHLVWVIEVGGRRVMHLGDSSPSRAELAAAAGSGVDLLLAPFWVLGGQEGLERIAATGATRVAAFHFAKDARPYVGSREITPLQAAGQVLVLEGRSPSDP